MPLTARDEPGKDIDVSMRLEEDENREKSEGVIAALNGESVFYSRGKIEDDETEIQDEYVDLGDNCPDEIKKKLEKRISEASENVLSKSVVLAWKRFINGNKSDFTSRLGSERPARDPPKRKNRDRRKKPVKAKVRKHPLK